MAPAGLLILGEGTTYTKHRRYMDTSSKHSPKACHRRSYDAPPRDRGYRTRSSRDNVVSAPSSVTQKSIETTYENNDTEATSGEEQVDPGLDLVDLDVVAGRDDAGFVQTTVELDNDLARTVVIDNLELADVAYEDGSVSNNARVRAKRQYKRQGRKCQ